jgi:DNA repair exonuclease SbcCD nuclease subunit
MKYLACADLHCSKNEEVYSLSVLDEIIDLCVSKKADGLFLAGDIFDSFQDAEALRNQFSGALKKLPENCKVHYIPGNHEELRASGSIENFDFGRACLVLQKPFGLIPLDPGIELLAIPFQKDYIQYRSWQVPSKDAKKRILLAHGTVPGVGGIYTGPEEENAPGVLDQDLFSYLEADLAIVGHLHSKWKKTAGNCVIVSPGSARVWREGETGGRRILLIDTDLIQSPEEIVLQSAGEYRSINVEIRPDYSLNFQDVTGNPSPDWLCLNISGAVEDEKTALEEINKKIMELQKKFRRVTFDKEELFVLEGITGNYLALQFIKKWEESCRGYPDDDAAAYQLAKMQGLAALKKILDARK